MSVATNEFVAIIKTSQYRPVDGPIQALTLTSLEVLYADGRDCGVPLFVSGYEEAAELLALAGVSPGELKEKRANFEKGNEVRFKLCADNSLIEAMGFDPRPF